MFKQVLAYDTTAKAEIRNITDDVNRLIEQSGVDNGTLLVYSLHTTHGLIVQETSEPHLCQDFIEYLTGTVEDDGHRYHHTCALHPSGACVEDRFNAPSHVRQLLTNQSVVPAGCEHATAGGTLESRFEGDQLTAVGASDGASRGVGALLPGVLALQA